MRKIKFVLDHKDKVEKQSPTMLLSNGLPDFEKQKRDKQQQDERMAKWREKNSAKSKSIVEAD